MNRTEEKEKKWLLFSYVFDKAVCKHRSTFCTHIFNRITSQQNVKTLLMFDFCIISKTDCTSGFEKNLSLINTFPYKLVKNKENIYLLICLLYRGCDR